MQKGDIAKLKLLLAGISARMTKNRDYFIRAVCTFTSGKKKFDAELSLDGQNWALRFQGSTSPTDAAAFCAFFASEAEKFDESVLVYTERSAVVTLSATARGVQMKQAEREASNDVLTDSMRALKLEAEGYKVSVVEYISPLDTPKNLLIRAVRTGRENRRAKSDYEAVRRTLGTTSELDRRCMDMENEFFVTDEDLIP